MAEVSQVYKCSKCGNVIEVVHGGVGQLVCCGVPMELLLENTSDAVVEKHIPIVEKNGNLLKVTVGSVAHPMEENHYIEWIEVISEGKIFKKFLKPGILPQVEYVIEGEISVRAYCNLHGLWKA